MFSLLRIHDGADKMVMPTKAKPVRMQSAGADSHIFFPIILSGGNAALRNLARHGMSMTAHLVQGKEPAGTRISGDLPGAPWRSA